MLMRTVESLKLQGKKMWFGVLESERKKTFKKLYLLEIDVFPLDFLEEKLLMVKT